MGQTVKLPGDNWVGSWTHTLNGSVFNEARFGYTHFPTQFDILSTLVRNGFVKVQLPAASPVFSTSV